MTKFKRRVYVPTRYDYIIDLSLLEKEEFFGTRDTPSAYLSVREAVAELIYAAGYMIPFPLALLGI